MDIRAGAEYQNRPPMPPTYIFLFDVSQPAIDSGYIQQAAYTIKGIIEEGTLPGGDRIKVMFMAFDKNLYFFNLRQTLKQPQMMVVTDTNPIFLPCMPEDLLVNLADSYDLVLNLLDNFGNYFANSQAQRTQESNFVAAIRATNTIANKIGGKVLLF